MQPLSKTSTYSDGIKQIKEEFQQSKFWEFMAFDIIELKKGSAVIQLQFKPEFRNVHGFLHGGAIMSLIDAASGIAATTVSTERVATIQMEVRFIKSVDNGSIKAVSKIIHEGKSTCIIECKVMDESDNLIALSTGTFKK